MPAPVFRFYNPVKIISGHAALNSIGNELSQMGAKRVLIVTDRGVRRAGLIDIIKEAFKEAEQSIGGIYDRVIEDSSPQVVNEGAQLYRKKQCDSIVAVGGGSVIDTAKAVNVLISEGSEDLMQLLGTKLKKPMQPFIAVPTTAGTGSEVTYAAMIMNAEQNMKIPLFSYLLFPKTAILDPRMTLPLPPKVTASSAVDALTHAIEAFICTSKNPFSDAHSLAAIRLIRENLLRVIRDGNDGPGRFQLANAACMAGAAFSNSGVGLVHALGHALGGVCRIPHGVAMNIFLPHGLEYNLKAAGPFIGELLLPLAGAEVYVQTPLDERPRKTIETINKFRDQLYRLTKLARTLKEARVAKKRLEEVAEKASRDPAAQFNPVRIQRKDMLELLNRAYG